MTDDDLLTDTREAVTGAFSDYYAVGHDELFGEPIEKGDRTFITASSVERIGGFGFGGGQGEAQGQDVEGDGGSGSGVGGGGGGGGTLRSRPVAVIELSEDGVRVEPVIDFTNVLVSAALALGAFLTIGRRLR